MPNSISIQSTKPDRSPLFRIPASPQDLPLFRTLRTSESQVVLARNGLATIALVVDGRVQMLPVHYFYTNGWIYGRTAAATQLPAKAALALQVKEFNPSRGWVNVVVEGQLDLVDADFRGTRPAWYEKLWSLMRSPVSATPADKQQPRLRDQLFGVRATSIVGRASLPVTRASCSA